MEEWLKLLVSVIVSLGLGGVGVFFLIRYVNNNDEAIKEIKKEGSATRAAVSEAKNYMDEQIKIVGVKVNQTNQVLNASIGSVKNHVMERLVGVEKSLVRVETKQESIMQQFSNQEKKYEFYDDALKRLIKK